MRVENTTKDQATVVLDRDELDLIANALNEICHGLSEREFSTRVGARKPEALKLLHYVSDAIDQLRS